MTDADTLIHWLLDNKLAKTFVHKESQEQMVEITEFGIEINTILDKLKTTSNEAKQTNEILKKSEFDLNKIDEDMTPYERCYKILQDSKYIRIPQEDLPEIISYFLKAIDGCSWEYPKDAVQEKQFETNVKSCFSQFHNELFQFAKDNPATRGGESPPFKEVGLHTMDDQGFEGQIMSDGTYVRTIDGETEYIFFKVSDEELEEKWQEQASLIKNSLLKAYDKSIPKEESDEMFKKAKEAQSKQETIQVEITRRHK